MKKILNRFQILLAISFILDVVLVISYVNCKSDYNKRESVIRDLKTDNFNLEQRNYSLEYDLWTCNKAIAHKDTLIKYMASGEFRILDKDGNVVRR